MSCRLDCFIMYCQKTYIRYLQIASTTTTITDIDNSNTPTITDISNDICKFRMMSRITASHKGGFCIRNI